MAATGGRDYEHAEIRFDPAGGVVLLTGSMDHGQGHATTFKQVLSEKLGIDADKIRYRWGDSDLVTMGIGTFGSRSAQLAGSAIVGAADRLIEKGRHIAAHMMEAAADDIVFERGRFLIAGTDRAVSIDDVARRAFQSAQLPGDIEVGFTERSNFGPENAATFPSGAHVCEVEIDADTGEVALTRYCAVDDVGTMLNPLLCEGQIHGGIVQGLGQVLLENLVYDPESGQLLSGSFLDYAMPRADNFCRFELRENATPTDRNPLGVKGVGEAGTIGAIPAVMNAINDALAVGRRPGDRDAGHRREGVARAATAMIDLDPAGNQADVGAAATCCRIPKWRCATMILRAYLDRIGYTGPRRPDLTTLRGVVAAHATSIPFENIDVLLGRGIRLDTASLTGKLVAWRPRRILLRAQHAVVCTRCLRSAFRSRGSRRACCGAGPKAIRRRAATCCCACHCWRASFSPMSGSAG